ncbi:HNH endonuclease [Streptomyces sp. NPDC006655]|uniref:HNH endonuclease n=1 Tax=Streptomyces sp. NPDC006655 TaxID=3156898 RepID=UPI0034568DA2
MASRIGARRIRSPLAVFGPVAVTESIRLRPSLLPSVHRVVFKRLLGRIPEGFQVSHAEPRPCHHTRCCSPNRLEVVIKEESVARSD